MTLRKGRVYAVVDEDDRVTDALLWGTLVDTCASGGTACLISAVHTARSLQQSGLDAQVRAALAEQRLVVLEASRHTERAESRVRQRQLVRELQHWANGRTGLLVVDGAERLFHPPDEAMLAAWRDWAEQHGNTVLLLFRQGGIDENGVMQALAPHAHLCTGMARVKSMYGATAWEVFHWFCGAELVSGKSFPLGLDAQRRPEVPNDGAQEGRGHELAADETRVLAQRAAFLAKEPAPSGWQLADGQPEELFAHTVGAVAATVVLAFSSATDFERLVRCVFELRKQHGARLKIVIREMNKRLRYGQETLAVRLGANLVVPAEVSHARFLSLVSMVQGQVFPHPLPATFEQAMADTMPQPEQGYLPPDAFSQTVAATLERSRMLHVQNVLLRLPLAYGLLPLDALRYCNVVRAGDLCTADRGSVYLFLYACRESDVDKALERLFGLPVGELFSSEDRWMSIHGIRDAMVDLDTRNLKEGFPDLSGELEALMPARMPVREGFADAVPGEKKNPAILRHRPPVPAVSRPLPVKGTPTLTEVPTLAS